jgi:hypothetical protein
MLGYYLESFDVLVLIPPFLTSYGSALLWCLVVSFLLCLKTQCTFFTSVLTKTVRYSQHRISLWSKKWKLKLTDVQAFRHCFSKTKVGQPTTACHHFHKKCLFRRTSWNMYVLLQHAVTKKWDIIIDRNLHYNFYFYHLILLGSTICSIAKLWLCSNTCLSWTRA